MRHTLAILLTTLLSCATAWGQPVLSLPPYIKVIGENDTLPAVSDDELFDNGIAVYFKVNSTRFASTDKGFLQLRHDLTHIPDGYKFCQLIVLRGSASPEGPADNNRRLAHQRARALTDSLRKYVTLPESTIVERFINEDYAGLQRLMVASDEPYRDDVLNALDLSQIVFTGKTASDDITVTLARVYIHQIHKHGTYYLTTQSWELTTDTTYYPNGRAKDITINSTTTAVDLTDTDLGPLMLLPQKVDAASITAGTQTVPDKTVTGAYLEINGQIKSGDTWILGSSGHNASIYYPLAVDWEPGKKYIYNLIFGQATKAAASVSDWK